MLTHLFIQVGAYWTSAQRHGATQKHGRRGNLTGPAKLYGLVGQAPERGNVCLHVLRVQEVAATASGHDSITWMLRVATIDRARALRLQSASKARDLHSHARRNIDRRIASPDEVDDIFTSKPVPRSKSQCGEQCPSPRADDLNLNVAAIADMPDPQRPQDADADRRLPFLPERMHSTAPFLRQRAQFTTGYSARDGETSQNPVHDRFPRRMWRSDRPAGTDTESPITDQSLV
nr:hypothetical protein [Fodinicola feengrottensis]